MNYLARVQARYSGMTRPKAISHRPDLAGRIHIISQSSDEANVSLDAFVDYATVYGVYTWVHKAVSVFVQSIAGLPVRVVDANEEAIDGHPLTELFAFGNDAGSAPSVWEQHGISKLLGGEAFLEIVPDRRGDPLQVWVRRPDHVSVIPDASPERKLYPRALEYRYSPTGRDEDGITIEAGDMIHDRFHNPLNPWRGLAPIAAVREGIVIDMFAQAWSKAFLKRGARPDYALIAPQGTTTSERDKLEAMLALKFGGSDGWHRPIILEDGITDIKTFSFPPKDIEWLEQRKVARDEVGSIFGIPDLIMGWGTETYDTEEKMLSALKALWTLALVPFVQHRDWTLTAHFRKIRPMLKPGERVATDLSGVGVLQEDRAPKIQQAVQLWSLGVPFNTLDKQLGLGIGPIPGGEIGYLPAAVSRVKIGEEEETAPADSKDILGYHIEQGVVTRNEARADVGLPPIDDAEGERQRKLKATFEVLQAGVSAGLPVETALQLVGLRVELPATAQAPDEEDDAVDDEPPASAEDDETEERAAADALLKYIPQELAIQRALKRAFQQIQNDVAASVRAGNPPALWTRGGAEIVGAIEPHVRGIGPDGEGAALRLMRRIIADLEGRLADWPTRSHDDITALFAEYKSDAHTARLARLAIQEVIGAAAGPFEVKQVDDERPEEAELAEALGLVWDEQQERFVEAIEAGEEPDYDALAAALLALLAPLLARTATRRTLALAEVTGVEFDPAEVSDLAAAWAREYSFGLVRGLTETTRGVVSRAVEQFVNTPGMARADLVSLLEPAFGRVRAEMIAATEVTRAYSQGVARYQQLLRANGIETTRVWETRRDERTCPVCFPLHDKTEDEWARQFAGGPPAHVRCRCNLRLEQVRR